ncbi:killer toxin [Mariannaea sp. PMI_226]|nr:killer toxin [Mariannaea sp. PMI_226]
MKYSLGSIFLAAVATTVNGLGINCEGSGQCGPLADNNAQKLVNYINGIDPNRWYNNGQLIACSGFVCAFLQNTGGAPGRNIKGLAHFITEHGCKNCGSVPYFYPSDNNVADGELTFNAVGDPSSCKVTFGLCK